jgi:glycosyl transferase family 87
MRWRDYGLALGWPMLVAWVSLVATLLLTFHPTVGPDSNMYYDTARALRAMPHADLAQFATTVWGGKLPGACPVWDGQSYKYPPLLAILFAPLTLLSCAGATMVWRIVTLILWGLCAFALTRAPWRPGSQIWAFLACALVALYLPLIDGMLLGQIHLAILASCLAGAALVVRRREFSGGAYWRPEPGSNTRQARSWRITCSCGGGGSLRAHWSAAPCCCWRRWRL